MCRLNISMAVIIYIVLLNSSNILSRTVLKDSEKRGEGSGIIQKITSIFTIKKGMHIRGEYILQEKYGTQKKAEAFYKKQMLDHVNDPSLLR